MILDDIRANIALGRFEFSEHAVEQSIVRHISVREVREVVAHGEIIEEYPDDKYGPSYLLFGFTREHRPLHVQCSHPARDLVKIVTLYQPDPGLWVNYRTRRPPP
jgi:hypothetical protein